MGLSRLGFECVFACEIDADLRQLYNENFGIAPVGDIRSIDPRSIPVHDVLCAGFPCQPYSKAGDQLGLDCEEFGDTLFRSVMRIVRFRRPRYLILENVPNITRHDGGRTWHDRLRRRIRDAGYQVKAELLSPHQFGIPQKRQRFFAVASRGSLENFRWPTAKNTTPLSIKTILDNRPTEAIGLSDQATKCLEVWQEFLDLFPSDEQLPSFPIWSMEFGATYPYKQTTPSRLTDRALRKYRGSHGVSLDKVAPDERWDLLPSHARTEQKRFPLWKQEFIRQNRELYARHKKWIRPWTKRIREFPSSLQKFEWNCQGEARSISNFVIQFRASGVRLKRPTTAPSLVAMTTTQTPIIGWERRYMTVRECARLQSLNSLKYLPPTKTKALKAIGNAVNADIVERIGKNLCSGDSKAPRAKGQRKGRSMLGRSNLVGAR